jgi:hypothetical protein
VPKRACMYFVSHCVCIVPVCVQIKIPRLPPFPSPFPFSSNQLLLVLMYCLISSLVQ